MLIIIMCNIIIIILCNNKQCFDEDLDSFNYNVQINIALIPDLLLLNFVIENETSYFSKNWLNKIRKTNKINKDSLIT